MNSNIQNRQASRQDKKTPKCPKCGGETETSKGVINVYRCDKCKMKKTPGYDKDWQYYGEEK